MDAKDITPEMKAAGLRVLDEWDASDDYRRDALVGRVFMAMLGESWLLRDLAAKQAQIDSLMLEYCPDEMTPEQMAEWKKNQQAVKDLGLDGIA